MGVRWQITFKTCPSEHIGRVKVYDSTYSGDPIELEPAANPFFTSRQRQDIFQPLVSDSGYLRVIDDDIPAQHIEDIHPIGALDRPVEFYLDDVLTWRGYISPESFTVDWEPAPREIAFPLVGALSVLDSVAFTDNSIGFQPIAAFIKECLTATGFTWSNIVISTQMFRLYDGDVSMIMYDVPELRLSLSRYNFLRANNVDNVYDVDWTPMVGSTYADVLGKICQYFGWTAFAEGDTLYLASPIVDLEHDPVTLTYQNLTQIAANPLAQPTIATTERPVVNLSSLEWDGVNHRKSLKNGARRVLVTAQLNANSNIQPIIYYNGKKLSQCKVYVEAPGGRPNVALIGKVRFYDPSKDCVYLYAYEWDEDSAQFINVDWVAPQDSTYQLSPRGDVVEGETYETDWQEVSPDPDIYSKYLRLVRRSSGHDLPVQLGYPLATVYSNAAGFFAKGGALCLSAFIRNNFIDAYDSHDLKGLTQWGPFLNNLMVAIRIGNMWFDGSTWTGTTSMIPVEVEGETSGMSGYLSYYERGKIKNTNNGKWQDAEGFMIPIDQNLSGKLSISFYAWSNNSVTNADKVNAIYLSDLSLRYVNDLEDTNEGARVSGLTGVAYKDEQNVSLSLTSAKVPLFGLALLLWKNELIGSLPFFLYKGMGEPGYEQPEQWLLECLIKAYTKPSTWLELETALSTSLSMWDLIALSGKSYLINTCESDFALEHTKLIIVSYE